MSTVAIAKSVMEGSVKRVQLSNGDIWEVVKDTLTAVKLPGATPDDHTQQVKYDKINDFLRYAGFKEIRPLSEYAVTFEEIMPSCSKCKTNKNVVRAGRQNRSKSKHRRFICKSCKIKFTVGYS